MIWLLFTSESPLSLTAAIWESVEDDQLFETDIKSVESNFIISLGETVNKYFQRYPSPLVPALDGSRSVNVGSSKEALPVVEMPDDPLSIQI